MHIQQANSTYLQHSKGMMPMAATNVQCEFGYCKALFIELLLQTFRAPAGS
jgi:hypothetical protein